MVEPKNDEKNLRHEVTHPPDPFFSLSANSEWNALVGKQGEPVFYAEGYIEAALELAKSIVANKLYTQRDTLVMPILYNARHSIELHLKLIIVSGISIHETNRG